VSLRICCISRPVRLSFSFFAYTSIR
jgi:hypothetical protein